ncbi:MAG: substrate-binding domain-containing protein [Verrucomicrobia bacterium]|nr:substrate-binding domain-containing protein [Verrucomicrobiota bacterium]
MLAPRGNPSWEVARGSLAARAAALLRDAIHAGELRDPLPGEHELARRLEISRPSVGAALATLAAEGLIIVRQGCRSRLAPRARRRAPALPASACIVLPSSTDEMYQRQDHIRLELRARFASRGIKWNEVACPPLFGQRPEKHLPKLVASRQHTCWILRMAPEKTQRVFADAGLPTLNIGTCYPGIQLPSVDADFDAVGFHAASTILARGHTRIGLILPLERRAGDDACRLGFRRRIGQASPGTELTEIAAPEDPGRFRARLDPILRAPRRPTVLFTMRQPLTLVTLLHVLASGLQVPQEISLVSRDSHPLFEAAIPELTRYEGATSALANRIVRITANLLAGRHVAPRPSLVTPVFVPGGTLADLRR